jgi:hypothetical protein
VEPVFKEPAIRPLADASCEAMLCFNGDLCMQMEMEMEMNMLVMKVALSTSVVLHSVRNLDRQSASQVAPGMMGQHERGSEGLSAIDGENAGPMQMGIVAQDPPLRAGEFLQRDPRLSLERLTDRVATRLALRASHRGTSDE